MTTSSEAAGEAGARDFIVVGMSSKHPHAVWCSRVSETEAEADKRARRMVAGGEYLTAGVCRLVRGYERGDFMVEAVSGEALHGWAQDQKRPEGEREG